jgi:hypothetical protein
VNRVLRAPHRLRLRSKDSPYTKKPGFGRVFLCRSKYPKINRTFVFENFY